MRRKRDNEVVGIIGTGRFGMAVAEELLQLMFIFNPICSYKKIIFRSLF